MSVQSSPVYYLSWDEFHRDTRALATRLVDIPWKGVICIARGGLVPGAILARELGLRLVDNLCIASYDHDRQGDVSVVKGVDGDGDGFLLVDDLIDTGKTARVALELLPKATFVTVYAKPAARELVAHHVRDFDQNVWVHFPWDVNLSYSEPLANRLRG